MIIMRSARRLGNLTQGANKEKCSSKSESGETHFDILCWQSDLCLCHLWSANVDGIEGVFMC